MTAKEFRNLFKLNAFYGKVPGLFKTCGLGYSELFISSFTFCGSVTEKMR